jgi:hypothetical protein
LFGVDLTDRLDERAVERATGQLLETLRHMRGYSLEYHLILFDFGAQSAEKFLFSAHALDIDADAKPTLVLEVFSDLVHQPSLTDAARRQHLNAGPRLEEARQFRALLAPMVHDGITHSGSGLLGLTT